MIQKLEIAGVHTKLDETTTKYAQKKIGILDRYAPRHARESMHAEVFLKESRAKDKKQYTCEVVLHLPGGQITSKESTFNMIAAIDIVEAKLKNQLKKYKEMHGLPSDRLHRRVLARLQRRTANEEL